MKKPFDIILWGATGYTGQLVADYLAQNVDSSVRWAIAGRNQEKLEKLRDSLALPDLPILLGESQDRASLEVIVAQTKVIISTVGPYALYGTPLVAACVAQGVSYCDLTGETLWMRQNIDSFHTEAEESGARIVHCCGYDSIPQTWAHWYYKNMLKRFTAVIVMKCNIFPGRPAGASAVAPSPVCSTWSKKSKTTKRKPNSWQIPTISCRNGNPTGLKRIKTTPVTMKRCKCGRAHL